jgi:hypothetical protein
MPQIVTPLLILENPATENLSFHPEKASLPLARELQ